MSASFIDSALETRIRTACRELENDLVQMTSALIAFPSLLGQEHEAQDYMAERFDAMGLEAKRLAIDEHELRAHPAYSPSLVSYEGRENVIGIHRPRGDVHGRSLILNGHIDVVPVGVADLWTDSPWSPRVDGDRLYGRGAADMKAGIAAYTLAFDVFRRLGLEPAAPVYLQSVIEEECTGNGALACLVAGYEADAAVITEPVPGIMRAQMGVVWLHLDVTGRPVHAREAHAGASAIEYAYYLYERLKTLEAEWNQPENRHPDYADAEHPINFNLGRIDGGEWGSSVACACSATLRIGFYPGRDVEGVVADVEAALRSAAAEHPKNENLAYRIRRGGFAARGCEVDMQHPMISVLGEAHHDVTGRAAQTIASPATTDAKHFNLYGTTPATCYGPVGGGIHGIDEWVSIESLVEVTTVLAVFIARWCGVNVQE